jgi:hypothetical protein
MTLVICVNILNKSKQNLAITFKLILLKLSYWHSTSNNIMVILTWISPQSLIYEKTVSYGINIFIKNRLNMGNICCHSGQILLSSHLLWKMQILNIQNYNFGYCLLWVWNSVPRMKGIQAYSDEKTFGLKRDAVKKGWKKLYRMSARICTPCQILRLIK